MLRLHANWQKVSKLKAPRNRTLTLNKGERDKLKSNLLVFNHAVNLSEIINKTIWGDTLEVVDYLPGNFVDLLVLDPPYNLNKSFNGRKFLVRSATEYETLLDRWIAPLIRLLKPTASVYICGDWRSSGALFNSCSKYFKILNRITWEREKGRGAKANWKNCAEDIWYCSLGDQFTFNMDRVKLRRTVLAPYRYTNGQPKDWTASENGNYRNTAPSNLWTDITVPFWSMPENTDHPTQKPEKLLARIILASSRENDIILDPFLGSGTTSVVAKKLGRRYVGIERDLDYCLLTEKRLNKAEKDKHIQGFENGVFWERNSLNRRQKK